MKLAEKIMTLRKQRGWSQEELAQQLSVSRQSVSKWESGASVPDLDKILKMSEIFGVSTDTLLKEEMELNERKTTVEDLQNEQMKTDTSGMTNFCSNQNSTQQQFGEDTRSEEIPTHHVSMQEARDYLEWAKHKAPWIALGTFLCILSPVWLLLLGGMAEYKVLPITEDMAGGMGVAILLGIVAVAVAIFIIKGAHQERFGSFETQHIVAEEEVRKMVLEEQQEFAYYLCTGYNIDFTLVMALIQNESSFDPAVISKTNDYGYMQINQINHQWLTDTLGVTDFTDPYQNIRAGVFVLRKLFERYQDTNMVLMAYNMGEDGAARLWEKGIYSTDYTEKILNYQTQFNEQLEGSE